MSRTAPQPPTPVTFNELNGLMEQSGKPQSQHKVNNENACVKKQGKELNFSAVLRHGILLYLMKLCTKILTLGISTGVIEVDFELDC